jgi:hypothetical protein
VPKRDTSVLEHRRIPDHHHLPKKGDEMAVSKIPRGAYVEPDDAFLFSLRSKTATNQAAPWKRGLNIFSLEVSA